MLDNFPTNYISAHPRHGVPRAPFTYSAPLRALSPLSMTVYVPAAHVRNLYACYVWNAGILLADRITAGEVRVRGRRVLELGAGTGLPGLVAAKMGAEKVVLSDFDDAEMRRDLETNVSEALDAGERARTHVVMHSWGSNTAALKAAGPFDQILLADVVWDVPSHALLLASLIPLLTPSTEVYIIVGYHTGRAAVRQVRVPGPTPVRTSSLPDPDSSIHSQFFASARDAGLSLMDEDEWEEVSVEGERRKVGWVARWGEERESQEERARWVLEGTMRLFAGPLKE